MPTALSARTPPDAGHQFLADAGAVVAAVKPRRQLPVLGTVARHVAIQQVQVDPAHVHQPHLGQQLAGAGVDADGDRLAVGAQGRLHRQVLDLGVEILFVLPAVDIEMLLEIALVVEQSDGHQRHAQPAGALDVVAREHAQAAGIDGHRLVDAELEGEVGHRLGAEHAGVGSPPRGDFAHVLLQPAIGLADAAIEHQFRGPHFQPFGGELRKQGDRVVVQLPPADGVEVAEEVDHLGVPAPPQVSCQRDALVVQGFRRKSNRCRVLRLMLRKRFDLTHIDLLLQAKLRNGPKHRIIAAGAKGATPDAMPFREAQGGNLAFLFPSFSILPLLLLLH